MGLLQEILGQLGDSKGSNSQQQALIAMATKLLSNESGGGLAGLLKQFESKGLGEQVASWVGLSENKPLSGGQVTEVLGSEQVQQFAKQAGIDPEHVSKLLAQLLPKMIDKLTPKGKVPEGDALQQGLGALEKLLG
jgi:uncharacterized protein YidB (DUF937 family)